MSEPTPRPDVASVLQILRAQAEQVDIVHVRDVEAVKQISDRVAEILGIERIRPTVRPVLDPADPLQGGVVLEGDAPALYLDDAAVTHVVQDLGDRLAGRGDHRG